ncbi:hypothetical protein [Spirosoma sp.]|uniref:hypothetical protein n=1 Tax=Spirosoma sp. TaxID=1899569 RepID=UPI003B3A1273
MSQIKKLVAVDICVFFYVVKELLSRENARECIGTVEARLKQQIWYSAAAGMEYLNFNRHPILNRIILYPISVPLYAG